MGAVPGPVPDNPSMSNNVAARNSDKRKTSRSRNQSVTAPSGAGRPRLYDNTVSIHFRCNEAFRAEIGSLADRFRLEFRSRAAFYQKLFHIGLKKWVRAQWTARGPEDRTPTAAARFANRLGIRYNAKGELCLPGDSGRLQVRRKKGSSKASCSLPGLDPLLLALLQYHGEKALRRAKEVSFKNGNVTDLRRGNLEVPH